MAIKSNHGRNFEIIGTDCEGGSHIIDVADTRHDADNIALQIWGGNHEYMSVLVEDCR